MYNHRFILEKYKGRKSRFTCPSCNKQHQFTRYVDTESGQYLNDKVGICNRRTKCGYHLSPKQYFNDHKLLPSLKGDAQRAEGSSYPKLQPGDKEATYGYASDKLSNNYNNDFLPLQRGEAEGRGVFPDFIDPELFTASQSNYNSNNLIKYLDTLFDEETVNHLINIYKIGYSARYGGGTTIFWQIDTNGNIRTGKLIKYNPLTGKRQKEPFVATNWVHAIHYKTGFNLNQCLYGEHLLKEDLTAPIAIVESEKTAIIAQAKMPDYLWLATGSMQEFKPSKLNVLKGRQVVAFPDLGAYDYWLNKTALLEVDISVSDYLEKNASDEEREKGLDIADFL